MISPVKIWRNQKKIRQTLGKIGRIVSFTTVFVPPEGYGKQAPYVLVLVKFDDGSSFLSQLVDCEKNDVAIGKKVLAILRKTRDAGDESIIPYGIKFKAL